jgi:HK97 family phage major capsid protein
MNEFEKRALALHQQMQAILDKAKTDNRGLTADERTQYDQLKGQREQQLFLAKEAKDNAELEARLNTPFRPSVGPAGATGEGSEGGSEGSRAQEPRGIEIRVGQTREVVQPFRSLGDQLMAVRNAAQPNNPQVDLRLYGPHEEFRAATGLSEAVPSDGGFLVQKDFAPTLLERTYATGSLLSRVDTLPIGPGSNGMKLNGINETSRADGSRMGGIRAYWANEADLFTASKPKFRQMEMNLHKIIGLVYTTDELLQDATALGAWVQSNLPNELRFKAENAIINGTGAGQPLGILASGSLVSVAAEAGQGAATIVYENIVKMFARHYSALPTYVGNPASYPKVWLINQDTIPQLYTMGLTIGVGGAPVFIPANAAAGRPFNELFGLPILPVEYCATLGTVGDILLVDLSEYQMIEKGGVRSEYSLHVRFLYDEGVFRFIWRVDGQPKWHSALTPFKGTATVSPFVGLATRA